MKARLEVEPRVREQEISGRRSQKYEDTSAVSGEMLGKRVTGYAVVELVGDWI